MKDKPRDPKLVHLTPEQVKKIRPGPIQHEEFDPLLTAWMRRLFQRIGHLTGGTFEEWELSFMRDLYPASELGLWEVMARAHEAYLASHAAADPLEVMKTLNAISLQAIFPDKNDEVVNLQAAYEQANAGFRQELKDLHLTTVGDVAAHCAKAGPSG